MLNADQRRDGCFSKTALLNRSWAIHEAPSWSIRTSAQQIRMNRTTSHQLSRSVRRKGARPNMTPVLRSRRTKPHKATGRPRVTAATTASVNPEELEVAVPITTLAIQFPSQCTPNYSRPGSRATNRRREGLRSVIDMNILSSRAPDSCHDRSRITMRLDVISALIG
jgi:hypothetical protein